jgi:hypothetical protein
MKVYEALAEQIKKNKQIEALMQLKKQKEHELREIRLTLRKLIQR